MRGRTANAPAKEARIVPPSGLAPMLTHEEPMMAFSLLWRALELWYNVLERL